MNATPKLRADVALMPGYHSPQLEVDVRLNTNESPYAPPPAFTEALAARVSDIGLHRYPDRTASVLRAALAEHHGVRPDQVFAANGSNEVLLLALLAFGGPGRDALVFEPTYALHSHIARLTGTGVVTRPRSSDDFLLDPAEAADAARATGAALTFLCSPNNPTGRTEAPEVIGAVAATATGLLIVDEAYGQFSTTSAIPLVADDAPVVVARTFSKTWALAGLRLGYVIAPAAVVEAMERVALPYHLDALKQAAGALALEFDAEMRQRVAAIVGERDRLALRLADLDIQCWPSEANFILFRPRSRVADDVWQALVDRSVLIRNCASWPALQGCLRVTIGTAEENDRFFTALTEALA